MPHQPIAPRRHTLSLPADAQWFVHHLVSQRLDSDGPPVEAAAPDVARRVHDKLEAGDHAFTRPELRFLRAELVRYLRTTEPTDRTGATARRTVRLVDQALGRTRPLA